MYCRTRGLVLRETNYKESDKILTVLTQDMGKRTVKARGCRRKGSRLAASAQLLVYSDMTLFEYKDYFTMNEAESLEQFRGLRNDLALLALASYFAEVTEAVAEEGVFQPELLSLILNSIYALDKLQKPPKLVKAAFELRLLCLAGYEPLLDACADCGEEEQEKQRFSTADGVLRCDDCAQGTQEEFQLTRPALSAMRYISCADARRLFSFTLEENALDLLEQVTEAFLLTQLDRGFRTLDFYHQVCCPVP